MPDEHNNNQGANGDEAAAKAAADQATADAAATAAASAAGEETVTIKKSDLKKIEDDRDNYKNIGLQKKADERNLHGGGEGGGSGGTAGQVDEKKIAEAATAATNKVLRDASERTAKRIFLQKHPEYVDDGQWAALVSNLSFKGTELTHDEVVDRMEAALFEHKRSTGKLDEYLKSEHERGVAEGRIQAEAGFGRGTGAAGDRNDATRAAGSLSQKGEEMARFMHTDPAKVKKIDIAKDSVINVV